MPRSIDNHGLIRKIGTTTRTVSERPRHSDVDPDEFSDELERQEDESSESREQRDDETPQEHPLLRPRDSHSTHPSKTESIGGRELPEDTKPMTYESQPSNGPESSELDRGNAVDVEA